MITREKKNNRENITREKTQENMKSFNMLMYKRNGNEKNLDKRKTIKQKTRKFVILSQGETLNLNNLIKFE